jgi:tetratricopeptide (TPR) repeat protein
VTESARKITALMRQANAFLVLAACTLLVGAHAFNHSEHQFALQSWRAGEQLDAESRLRSLLEFTDDPGLIAFNLGVMAAERGEYREAELHFVRTLDDDEISHERRVRAMYNRGVCLLHRPDTLGLRTAIQCFEQCLELTPRDGALVADAKHNLELAKLLWLKQRQKQSQPPTPNDELPEEPRSPPLTESVTDGDGRAATEQKPAPQRGSPRPAPDQSPQLGPAAGTLPVVSDTSDVQRLAPEDTTTLLDRIELRLQNARRQNEQLRAGPDRPNVRDW